MPRPSSRLQWHLLMIPIVQRSAYVICNVCVIHCLDLLPPLSFPCYGPVVRVVVTLTVDNALSVSATSSPFLVAVTSCLLLSHAGVSRVRDLRELGRSVRLSLGTGVSMRLGAAKVEFNYVWPLWVQATDK